MRFPKPECWSRLPFVFGGIFPTQGLTQCLLHWQVDSSPLGHQGSPTLGWRLPTKLQHMCSISRLGQSTFFNSFSWKIRAYSNSIYFKSWEDSCQFSSVQSPSRVQLFATPWTTARQSSLSITNSRSPPKSMSIELVMPSNQLILCCPLLLLPSIFHSIRVFSNESALCIRWPKYWSFRFNISPSSEHPGLISFRMDWVDHHVRIKRVNIKWFEQCLAYSKPYMIVHYYYSSLFPPVT